MNVPIRLRRPLVILGVVLSLLLGAASIRVAAAWTAASSPLAAKPPSVEALQADLATEQSRSTALQAQLDDLAAGSEELATALSAAREQIAVDATQARELQGSLLAAKDKLAILEKSIRDARASTSRPAAAPAAAAAPAREVEREDHQESEDD